MYLHYSAVKGIHWGILLIWKGVLSVQYYLSRSVQVMTGSKFPSRTLSRASWGQFIDHTHHIIMWLKGSQNGVIMSQLRKETSAETCSEKVSEWGQLQQNIKKRVTWGCGAAGSVCSWSVWIPTEERTKEVIFIFNTTSWMCMPSMATWPNEEHTCL